METGTPGTKTTPDTLMNRLIRMFPDRSDPPRPWTLGPVINNESSKARPRLPTSPWDLAAGRGQCWTAPPVGSAFDKLYSGDDPLSMAYKEGRAGRKALMESMQPAIDPMHTALDTRSVRNGANSGPPTCPVDAKRSKADARLFCGWWMDTL